MEAIFLEPYFRTKLWGGRKLETLLNYQIPDGKIGEAWIISGYRNDTSHAINGKFKGMSLRNLYQKHPELFTSPEEKEFPLLVKYLDANDNLSVQVYPGGEYAAIHENNSGKTEPWYVLQADPDSCLVYGHHVESRRELADMIHEGHWDDLLRKVPVKKSDFFYVPAGTIHALTKGIVVIETQQSSDVTYRLYDRDRVDQKAGQKQELHAQKSIDVTTIPHKDPKLDIREEKSGDAIITTLLNKPASPYLYLAKIDLGGKIKFTMDWSYQLFSVISGSGELCLPDKEYELELGDNFILPTGSYDFTFSGKLSMITPAPIKK